MLCRLFVTNSATIGILHTPIGIAAIKAVNIAKVFFYEKLGGTLAAVAVIATNNQRDIQVSILHEVLYGLVINMNAVAHVAGLKAGFIANVNQCHSAGINHVFGLLCGNTFKIEHETKS